MKYTIMLIIALFAVVWATQETYAQAIYGPQGQYLGYQQTSPSGVTNTYTPSGQNIGSSQVDNGQRSYYSPSGRYEGVTTAPSYNVPNTSIDTPRNAPQVRTVGGW